MAGAILCAWLRQHGTVLQECLCPTRVSCKSYKSVPQQSAHKIALQSCPARVRDKNAPHECPTRVRGKSAPKEWATRVPYKSAPQRVPGERVRVRVRVADQKVLHDCATRVSYKSSAQDKRPSHQDSYVQYRYPQRSHPRVAASSFPQGWSSTQR